MNQPTVFPLTHTLHPTDPHISPQDRPRLTGQNAAILVRLQRGPATNRELAGISLRYTSRVSDLRVGGGTLVPSATAVAEHIERDQLGRERMRVRVRDGRVIT